MKIIYDREVDALSIIFKETTVVTKHLADGITAELDSEGHVVGFEVLDASKRLTSKDELEHVQLQGLTAA